MLLLIGNLATTLNRKIIGQSSQYFTVAAICFANRIRRRSNLCLSFYFVAMENFQVAQLVANDTLH